MKMESFRIHGQRYSAQELIALCREKTNDPLTPSWEKQIYDFIGTWFGEEDYIIQFSSGTTGKSKELRLPKSSMIRSAENTCRFFLLTPGTRALLCLPVEYIAGKMMIVRSLVCGLDLFYTEPKSIPDLSNIPPIGFCAMVPLQVAALWKTFSGPSIETLIIGGAELSPSVADLLKNSSVKAYMTYGMSETCSHIAVRPVNGSSVTEWYETFPEITVWQDDRECLVISAPWLPSTVVTNDRVGFRDETHFQWLGRYDNLINSGGIKISPETAELELSRSTGYGFALLGVPDDVFGQRLIVVAEKNVPLADEDILSELSRIVPARVLPRKVLRIGSFPRNSSYKIDRRALGELIRTLV